MPWDGPCWPRPGRGWLPSERGTPPPVPDPNYAMTGGTALNLGRAVLQAAQVVDATRKEHKEIGRLVRAAVSLAVCRDESTPGVAEVADTIKDLVRLAHWRALQDPKD